MAGSTLLRVLGHLSAEHDGDTRPIGGPQAQQLFAILVAHADRPVSSDRLVDALWDDEPPRSATGTIQSLISRLRPVVGPGFAINRASGGYRLDVHGGAVDARQFESMLTRARSLDHAASLPVLETALALWQGAAFANQADLPAVRGEAMRLDELHLLATDAWAEASLATGDPSAMIGELESLVLAHPFRENFWRLLALALYRADRPTEALRRLSDLRELRKEAGIDPSPSLRALETQILAEDPALFDREESQTENPSPTVATSQLLGATSFVGRDPEVAAMVEAIASERLVTISGPGGVGKTRLAMQVAAVCMDHFDDGVTVVELAPLRDPSGVAQMVANALDIQRRQYRTIESTIEEYLAPTNCLLLLDNCEHVIEAVAPLADRLRSACPQVAILVTSREPLGLAGEYVSVLDPLDLPGSRPLELAALRRSPAVQLFVARAGAALPGFSLDESNAVAVTDICEHLEGLPLALELAAARLRTMGIETLASSLHQGVGLLGQTQRGADGRQRTLRDLVGWSHALLDAEEQHLFEQLAVFAGGFALPAVEAVCADATTASSTIDALASLVDKSMVVLVDPARPRYRLLEPLREFALERLRTRAGVESAEDRHLEWFVALAERAQDGLDSRDEPTWSTDLDHDFDNLRAAHLIAVRRGDVDSTLRLVAALREYAFRRVQYEVTMWADAAVDLAGDDTHPTLPTVLAVSAYGRFVRGDMDSAITLARRSLGDEIEGTAPLSHSGLAERVLGNAYFYLEQIPEAMVWMDRMVESARQSGRSAQVAHALYMRSVAETSIGNTVRGAVLAGEAKAVCDSTDSPTAHAQAAYALGLALESTDPTEALSHLEQASTLGATAGNRWIEAFSLTEVFWIQAKRGEPMAALTGFADVVDTWHRGGDWANQWLSLRRVLGILIDLAAFDAAAVLHGALAAVGAAHALPFEPTGADRLSASVEQLRSILGPSAFAEAVRVGASMPDGAIVAFAREQISILTDQLDAHSDGDPLPTTPHPTGPGPSPPNRAR